jgi:hypothetical protein
MNLTTFNRLIDELKFVQRTAGTIPALKRIFVDGVDLADAAREEGLTNSGLNKSKKRLDADLKEYLNENGLVHKDYVLSESSAAIADWLEHRDLKEAQYSTKKSKKVDAAAKALIQELLQEDSDTTDRNS